jgi:hypothetical protein
MAAEHFFDGGELCVQQTLHAIAPFPYWRNVSLFAAGRIFFERQELIDSIIAVCGEMNDDPDDQAQLLLIAKETGMHLPALVLVLRAASGFGGFEGIGMNGF